LSCQVKVIGAGQVHVVRFFAHINIRIHIEICSYDFEFGRFEFEFGRKTTVFSIFLPGRQVMLAFSASGRCHHHKAGKPFLYAEASLTFWWLRLWLNYRLL
jgi:hypothetical protein